MTNTEEQIVILAQINTLKDINIYNKKLLIRVDFNVPIENNIIKDDYRLKQVESTINYSIIIKVLILKNLKIYTYFQIQEL